MKIALVGYGKMGKTIERLALEKGHQISLKLNSTSTDSEWDQLRGVDVSIEFTEPGAALSNFERLIQKNVPVVTGTTGWYDEMDRVKQLVEQENGAFFWASNFSIGVNLFWKINKALAELMNEYPMYKGFLKEIHHTQKLDAPSGTAITTAEQILEHHSYYTSWQLSDEPCSEGVLPISAIREADVKGTHSMSFESPIDRITLTHEAKTRDGFALGAILAAEFLIGKPGFYTMDDLLS